MYQLLFHLATMHELRGEYGLAEQILDARLRLPRAKDGAAVQIDSDTLLACSLFHQGEFSRAIETAANGVGLYDPRKHAGLIATYGENPAVACHGWAALALWCWDTRIRRSSACGFHSNSPGIRTLCSAWLARKFARPMSISFAGICLRPSTGLPRLPNLADEHGYLYASAPRASAEGLGAFDDRSASRRSEPVHEGMALLDRIGANMDRPYLLALSSEIAAANGQPSEALAQVTEALGLVPRKPGVLL